MENLVLFRMKAHVSSALPQRQLVEVILECGLILFCRDRLLTAGVISKQSGVGVSSVGAGH